MTQGYGWERGGDCRQPEIVSMSLTELEDHIFTLSLAVCYEYDAEIERVRRYWKPTIPIATVLSSYLPIFCKFFKSFLSFSL